MVSARREREMGESKNYIMNVVNRGFIRIVPTEKFMSWAKSVAEETPFFEQEPEATIYLIEEEFWEDDKVLEAYYRRIFKQECDPFMEENPTLPECPDLEAFLELFEVELGSFVYDLRKENLERYEV